jgi:hypothetical protein
MAEWTPRPLDDEEKADLIREIERLHAEHPAPCELFTTTTGKCTCP